MDPLLELVQVPLDGIPSLQLGVKLLPGYEILLPRSPIPPPPILWPTHAHNMSILSLNLCESDCGWC